MKYLLILFLLIGCGGGSDSVTVDDRQPIEEKPTHYFEVKKITTAQYEFSFDSETVHMIHRLKDGSRRVVERRDTWVLISTEKSERFEISYLVDEIKGEWKTVFNDWIEL